MLDHLNQIAERAAGGASRRQFLGRAGHGAMSLAALLGGFLALSGEGHAAAVCGQGSNLQCLGRPVGSPCGSPHGPRGTCQSPPVCTCRVTRRK